MYVLVHVDRSQVSLEGPDNFREFKVVVVGCAPDDPRVASLLAPLGTPESPGHVFLRRDAITDLAGARASTAEWREGFTAMLEFARDRGWMDVSGTSVRAHIESA